MNYETPVSSIVPVLGKTIYIIGQAPTGEINNAVQVSNPTTAISLYGPTTVSPLSKAYTQFFNSGGITATLVRICGSNANVIINATNGTTVPSIELVSNTGGIVGNTYKVDIFANGIDIVIPGFDTKLFLYADYSSIEDLCKDININVGSKIKAYAIEPLSIVASIPNTNAATLNFIGGDDGLIATKNQLYTKLEETMQILLGRHMDVICLAGMYLDDVTPLYYENQTVFGSTYYTANRDYLDMTDLLGRKAGFHKLMIDFCKGQAELGIDTHCIIGMNKLDALPSSGYDFADKIVRASAVGTGDGIREIRPDITFDYGRHLSVVFGDLSYTDINGNTFVDNWAASYAALWMVSNYNDSLTNKQIPGVATPQYFKDEVVERLVQLGIVTYKSSPSFGLVVAGGITQAASNTPWYLSSNIKIVQRCLSMLYLDLITYFSNPKEPIINNNTISGIVTTSLNKRKNEDKIITNFDSNISYNNLTKTTTISIELYTIYSIEKIVASTSIQV